MYNRLLLSFILVGLSFFANAQILDTDNYRTYDGSFNNLNQTDWGAAGSNLLRLVPATFADGISTPTGENRPNPRTISNTLFSQENPINDPLNLSDFCWVFGQFIDHDLSITPDGAEPAFIKVPTGDPHFDPLFQGTAVIPMHRSAYDHLSGIGPDNPRQHPNLITAFIDGSGVYGSDEQRANWLRTFTGGKLKVSTGNLLPFNTVDGEFTSELDVNAPVMDNPTHISEKMYVAGDVRANENPLLLSFHTLFVREHNRLCDQLIVKHPNWTDEELYQYARKLVGGLIQSIVFDEWLPAMGVDLPAYQGYNETVNPQLSNVFTAAAFRLGHTLLNSTLRRIGNDGEVIPQGNLALQDAFFNIYVFLETGDIDPFFKGMATQIQQNMDPKLINDVRNFLFGPPGAGGLDLAAININRGRERGLPDFNGVRAALGLTPYAFFQQINSDAGVFTRLLSMYADIHNIDPWVGMLAEKPMPGALFGQTIMTIMKHHFTNLRDGDRFYYWVDPLLSDADRNWIKTTTLHDVIMNNTGIILMQNNVFSAMPHSEICASMTADVEGIVRTESGAPIANVALQLGLSEQEGLNFTTSEEGDFYFTDLFSCQVEQLSIHKEDGLTNGVSTIDLILIQKHILGLGALPTAYKMIAADIDRNGTISTIDLIFLRRAILGIDHTFPNNTSWRFIAADYNFQNPSNPLMEAIPEIYDFASVPSGVLALDFIGVKVGDVNESAKTTFQSTGEEAPIALMINTNDQTLELGEVVRVPFRLGSTQSAIIGYQFSVGFDVSSLDLLAVDLGDVDLDLEGNFGTFKEKGLLTTSWNDETGIKEGMDLFYLTFSVKKAGQLRDLVAINSALTPALAYDNQMEGMQVALQFSEQEKANQLFQNRPNPFKETTDIPFYIANSGEVHLRVFDVAGRMLYQQSAFMDAGEHQWSLSRTDLPAEGILVYQLEVEDDILTRRMVLD
ncbi:MAG: peroxidase family protein [Saprospiraceae bacterium]